MEVQVSPCDTGLGETRVRARLLRFNVSRPRIAAAAGATVSAAFDFICEIPRLNPSQCETKRPGFSSSSFRTVLLKVNPEQERGDVTRSSRTVRARSAGDSQLTQCPLKAGPDSGFSPSRCCTRGKAQVRRPRGRPGTLGWDDPKPPGPRPITALRRTPPPCPRRGGRAPALTRCRWSLRQKVQMGRGAPAPGGGQDGGQGGGQGWAAAAPSACRRCCSSSTLARCAM